MVKRMAFIKNKILIGRIMLSAICLMFLATTFHTENRSSGWYQQWFPNLNGSTITSMTFLDSLTGFAVTNKNSSNQSYILKTSNGGDNWIIQLSTYPDFNKIAFVDQNLGYASGYTNALFKTTNGGLNWYAIVNNIYPNDMAVLNKDTLLLVRSNILEGGVYRSTNGGLTWQALGQVGGTGQPNIIYMFDKNIGFCDDNTSASYFRKTTNGGLNWVNIPNQAFSDIKFIDSLVGWKCNGDIRKTTNGGLNWIIQQLPQLFVNNFKSISIINNNTVWGTGGSIILNGNGYGEMYKTTNGGINWGYQYADTSIHLGSFDMVNFFGNKFGWVYKYQSTGIHSLTEGNDTTFFTGMKLVENFVPSGYTWDRIIRIRLTLLQIFLLN
jgi:photosystem II stability/assembly factor-like uncharacterized protein